MARERIAAGGTLVLGGGFAGGYVARLLGKRGATVVSPENFMLYTPMLPEAASGTLEPRHTVVPLRMMCPHADLLLGRVSAVDAQRQRVQVELDGATEQKLGMRAHHSQRHDDVPRLERPGGGLRQHRRVEHEVVG